MKNSVNSQLELEVTADANISDEKSNVGESYDEKNQEPPAIGSPTGTREPLPELPYTLRTRKLSIAIVWTILLLDSLVLPLTLFFVLKVAADMDDLNILGISNGIFGFVTFVQYFNRLYRLLQPSPQYRPLGSSRWAVDYYQYQFTFSVTIIAILISLTIGPPLFIRVLALAPTMILLIYGPQFLFSCLAYKLRWKIPFRMSSLPKGSLAAPAVFTVVEDIIAVDGDGRKRFREAWYKRYHASGVFREMIFRITMFWGMGATVMGGASLGIAFGLSSKYLAFGLGWGLPFVWASVWAIITIKWVQKMLREEEETWDINGV
ncbi:hypothetical protein RUND412_007531 [Rhizina undulata]